MTTITSFDDLIGVNFRLNFLICYNNGIPSVTGPYLVVVAVKVAQMVQALELNHLQQEIDTELTCVMLNMHTPSNAEWLQNASLYRN